MDKQNNKNFQEAKRGISVFAAGLQGVLTPIQIVNLLVGPAICILRASGGQKEAERYFAILLDELKLDEYEKGEDTKPTVH